MCGGTPSSQSLPVVSKGLSPRVRGNRYYGSGVAVPFRSIPACAGEPNITPKSDCQPPVYPRVCGGTLAQRGCPPSVLGLSPRVRGNRIGAPGNGHPARSIPACAGEPAVGVGSGAGVGVYPRVCGGTCSRSGGQMVLRGLSPRVRGNRKPEPIC